MSNFVEMWEVLSGAIIVLLAAGIAWGKHQQKIEEHQKVIDNCHLETLMTEEKCKRFHEISRDSTENQLKGIFDMQKEMRDNLARYQIQLSAAVGRIENLAGRIERDGK